jgi:hypothetical protein
VKKAVLSKVAIAIIVVMLVVVIAGCHPGAKQSSKDSSGTIMKGSNEPNPNAANPGGMKGGGGRNAGPPSGGGSSR